MPRKTAFLLASLFLATAHAEGEGIIDQVLKDPEIRAIHSGSSQKYQCQPLGRRNVSLKCSNDAPMCDFRVRFNCDSTSVSGVEVVTAGTVTEVDEIDLNWTRYHYWSDGE